MSVPSLAEKQWGRSATEVAREVGASREAIELAWRSEIFDLHVDSYITARLVGYDLLKRHAIGFPSYGRFFGQLDLPRALAGGLTGAMWSVTTNIARPGKHRSDVFFENLSSLRSTLESSPDVVIVRTAEELHAGRAAGKHVALLAVQGGNAFESRDPANPGRLVTRVTLVHLSNSVYGATSSPARGRDDPGLTRRGRDFVRWLDSERIFVDLAHASPRSFWDAVETHDRSLPLIVTHTGIADVHAMWRNIDGRQVRAVADSGGVVAIIFHPPFLGPNGHDGRAVLDHVEAAITAGGEECVALGSDYDGAILPPRDLRDAGTGYYRLIGYMLERKWSEARIRRVLGENFVRSFARLRP